MAINSLTSFSMAKVKTTFIGKQNQIPVSASEVQVTAAPILPCRWMTSGGNLTEVRLIRTNRLNILSQPISDCLAVDEYHTVFQLLLQSDACYVGAAGRFSDHLHQSAAIQQLLTYCNGLVSFIII